MRQAFIRRELRQEHLRQEQRQDSTQVRLMAGVAAVVLAGLAQAGCTAASEELPTSAEATTSALQTDSPQPTSEANEPATTAAPTTAPVTTTTLERHEQAPHLFDLPGSDLVIVRAGPSVSTEQVTRIQAPRYAIEGTGRVETDEFGTSWRELHVGHGYVSTGWLEIDRLEISERTQVSTFDEPCAEAGVSEGAVRVDGLPDDGLPDDGLPSDATASGTADREADHIAQMWQFIGPGCDRLHVALGTDWDYGRGGELASEAPGGVTAEAFGSWVRITVPELEGARFDADLDDTWNLTALAARTAQGEFAINVYTPTCDFMRQMALSGPCVDHEITIDVYAPAPSEFAVRALSDPARLLIDVIPTEDISDAATAAVPKLFANCGTNAETVAVPKLFVDCSTIVPLDTPGDGSPIEVTLPWTVRGYAHGWFEFQGNVELYFADGSRAFGSIKGDGVVRPGISTGWGVRGGGYWSWGHFEFTIEAVALPPERTTNQYNLWVGWYQPIDDDIFSGVAIPFRLTD